MHVADIRDSYCVHSALSDPGRHAPAVRALGPDIGTCTQAVRGLLAHRDWLRLYGLELDDTRMSRGTRPVGERLGEILARDGRPLSEPRQNAVRAVGTCRDYALLLCGFLRTNGIPARVRCGFARYFSPGRWEDHWVCQYRQDAGTRWVTVDAQLDDEQRAELNIGFDTLDVPSNQFLFAGEAWQSSISEAETADMFGHGDNAGAWFMRVNLARDWLALHKREVSDWDEWRSIPPGQRHMDESAARRCDELAARLVRLSEGEQVPSAPGGAELAWLQPFWRV